MNQQQFLSLVRDVMAAAGIILTTLHVAGVTTEQWELWTGIVLTIAPSIWGLFNHTEANAVVIAASIPAVKKVEVEPTPAGLKLVKATGSTPTAQVTIAPGPPTTKI